MTQSNNAKFLPASAPSEHAAVLAAPFGTAGLQPVPVVAARTASRLTPADVTALSALQGELKSVSGVAKVLDAGVSPDGHAEQLVVLACQLNGGNPNAASNLVDALRAKIAAPGCRPGCRCTWPGTSPHRWTSRRHPATPGAR